MDNISEKEKLAINLQVAETLNKIYRDRIVKYERIITELDNMFDFHFDEETETIYHNFGDITGVDDEIFKLFIEVMESVKD